MANIITYMKRTETQTVLYLKTVNNEYKEIKLFFELLYPKINRAELQDVKHKWNFRKENIDFTIINKKFITIITMKGDFHQISKIIEKIFEFFDFIATPPKIEIRFLNNKG